MSYQLSVVIILSVMVMPPSTLTQEEEAIGSYDPTKAVYPGNSGGGDINQHLRSMSGHKSIQNHLYFVPATAPNNDQKSFYK